MAKCRYCPKEFVSSSTRCTAHLADWEGKKGHDITVCPDVPKEVVESIHTLQEGKCKKQLEKNRAEMAAMDAVSGKTSSGVGSKRGRMSDFYGAEGSVARREADDAICLYFAELGVPENQADNPLFRNMIRAVAAAGGSYVPPKRKYVGGAGLQRTRKRIEEGLDPVVKKWPEKGVTIASDMMSDRNGRAQANFLCVNEDGAVFMESVDCGMERKTGGYIASLIRPVITKVGPENVVALCMDGASNYAAATREIVKEWPHIEIVKEWPHIEIVKEWPHIEIVKEWPHIEIVPCATHVLDLFMEDIGKMDWAKKLVERVGELMTFLRNHHWTRAYLRAGELHGEKVLQALRPAGTRFGTQYLAVSRLCELRPHLSSMVSHHVFKDWAAAAGAKVKEAADKFEKYMLDSAWWKTAEFFKKLLQLPYVSMRKTDSTKKGMMANMYDLMLQLTEEMSALLEEDEEQLSDEDKEKISDFLKARWDDSLAFALHVAGRIFDPANQKEGIFLRDRECTKVMKEFLERAHDFLVKYKRGGAGGFKELQKGMLAYINGDGSFGTKSAVEAREEIRAGKGDLLSCVKRASRAEGPGRQASGHPVQTPASKTPDASGAT
ncbi:unnamed protein product [Closterium sp. NIES-64]|nr:unnamed protein product [Closterium sp. NIES-64]